MERIRSLKVKIISILMIAIPLAVVSYFFIYENVQERREAEIDKNIMITKSAALLVQQSIDERVDLLQKFAKLSMFRNGNPKEVQQYLEAFQPKTDEGFFVAEMDGSVVAQTIIKKSEKEFDLSQCPIIKKVTRGPFVSDQYKSVFTDGYVINVCVPIYDKTGKVVRIVGDQLSNSFFGKLLDPIKIGKEGRISLVDSSGYYIYDKTIENNDKLVESQCFYDGKGKDLNISERPSQRTGDLTIFTKVKIKSLDWYVVSFQRSAELTAPGMAIVTKNLLTLVLVFVVLLVLNQYQKSLVEQEELVHRQTAEKLALVGELAAGMAHEIRNPLTTIKGFANFLKGKEKYAEDKGIFNSITQGVLHIENLVNEILMMAKPQKMEMKQVDLQKIVEDAFAYLQDQALARGVNIELELCDHPPLIKGDEAQLRQVIINLTKNSLEATKKGGSIKIALSCPDRLTAKITVSDNGVGIRPEDFGKVGTPFFTTKDNGTGLGLLICQSVVEELGGVLEIKSSVGRGTSVEVFLPVI